MSELRHVFEELSPTQQRFIDFVNTRTRGGSLNEDPGYSSERLSPRAIQPGTFDIPADSVDFRTLHEPEDGGVTRTDSIDFLIKEHPVLGVAHETRREDGVRVGNFVLTIGTRIIDYKRDETVLDEAFIETLIDRISAAELAGQITG